MRVGVVVLHYRFPGVTATLRALAAQTLAPAVTVVVDNCSGDGSVVPLRSWPGVLLVEAVTNGGYAAGMNLGVSRLPLDSLDAVLLLTHECVLAPSALAALVARLEAAPTVGVVGPLLELRSRPGAVYSSGAWISPRWIVGHHCDVPDGPVARDWLDGAALLFRVPVLHDVGPLDESYFLYYEEVDWLLRVRRAGWSVECVPAARAVQESGTQGPYLFGRNRLTLIRRHAPRHVYLRELVRTAAWFAVKAPRGERLAGLRGLWHAATGRLGPPPA